MNKCSFAPYKIPLQEYNEMHLSILNPYRELDPKKLALSIEDAASHILTSKTTKNRLFPSSKNPHS